MLKNIGWLLFIAIWSSPLLAAELEEGSGTWPACGQVEAFPGDEWKLDDSAREDWSGFSAVETMFGQLESDSLMVVHQGRLVLSLGDTQEPRLLASLRKSVLSSLYGAYSNEHPIDLSQTMADLGINDSEPSLTPAERQANVQNLLMARSGIFHSAHYEQGNWRTEKRHAREWAMKTLGVPNTPPGQVWLYNNWDFNVLASVYAEISGESLGPAIQERLATPLGLQDYDLEDVSFVGNESYAERRMGNLSDHPAYMFHMSTRDLARIGLLYLNCGRWKGDTLIPEQWVLDSIEGVPIAKGAPSASKMHTYYGDYGWQWWVDKPGGRRTFWKIDIDQPVFFGQGYRGHYIWVAPYLDLVVVHQIATKGGVDTFSQLRRRFFGSPKVSDNEFQQMLSLIIAAHPRNLGL